jgi:hypothetical protein|tara:strand:+ start:109 stop:306 length:198 start_codon:yes stop_codon:yes gene_type:complete
MNDCQKIVNNIFICLVIIVLAIFLTGCHTFRYEWFPDKKGTQVAPPFTSLEEEPSPTVDVLKISF